MMMFLEPFKNAAAEGAVVELKLRLLAGSIPTLQQHALKRRLEDVETPVIEHFDGSLSEVDKETLRLCRVLRNKVLHTDFRAARDNLNKSGVETPSGEVKKIDIPVVTIAAISEKIRGVKAGTEGTNVADTLSTASGTIYGWFLEMGVADDFQKAREVFKSASALIDRLAGIAT
jgi:hypothetical protein